MTSEFVYNKKEWEEIKSGISFRNIFESRIVKKIPPSLIVLLLPMGNMQYCR